MKKEIVVVGAVITDGKLVLCAQRGSDMALPGMWEFPGGKLEQGETDQQALVREIAEELECEIQVGNRITTTRYEYDFGFVTLTTYYATVTTRSPVTTEHAELRWVEAPSLDALEWAPADIPAVELIKRELA
ncbi:(deoxy)nucleoside triphosphate pyrophosphohydrolase [Jonesiaceae bacterium BS-20]|uniref:8-oxo-dGTP diphosphatase n=1 Tax=Jonesiaceae bacterium BS-20 TaxID=3120821 RepID=A0AAU7DZG3_9MICO